MKINRSKGLLLPLILILTMFVAGCGLEDSKSTITSDKSVETLNEVPEFDDKPYQVINDNQPEFDESDKTEESFETYSNLDSLGRCGSAFANVSKDTMPTEKREAIGQVKPSGWHTVRYDEVIADKYLYNRCHLIGFQLTGENANERNLITGTRYLNTEGMLQFEDMIADYVKDTENHVLYRVTPIFEGDNLVASGVQMEALSVEDDGEGICFNVYAYNNQPNIEIDYKTGESHLADNVKTDEGKDDSAKTTYICNTNTKKYHLQSCSSVKQIKEKNKKVYKGTGESLKNNGYSPCKNCIGGY